MLSHAERIIATKIVSLEKISITIWLLVGSGFFYSGIYALFFPYHNHVYSDTAGYVIARGLWVAIAWTNLWHDAMLGSLITLFILSGIFFAKAYSQSALLPKIIIKNISVRWKNLRNIPWLILVVIIVLLHIIAIHDLNRYFNSFLHVFFWALPFLGLIADISLEIIIRNNKNLFSETYIPALEKPIHSCGKNTNALKKPIHSCTDDIGTLKMLEELGELKNQGILTDEEFIKEKSKILK